MGNSSAENSMRTNKLPSAVFSNTHFRTRLKHFSFLLQFFVFLAFLMCQPDPAFGQIAYRGYLSEVRIEEMRNIAERMNNSIKRDKYPCDNYYDYVCSRNRPMYSIMGNLPNDTELMHLFNEIQDDNEQFNAKRKVNDFFISCNSRKRIDDCYRETFEYFKPVFGYIITKHHIDGSVHEHIDFLDTLERFVKKADNMKKFPYHSIQRLQSLKDKFRQPHVYFRPADLNREYSDLYIFRESYDHNLRNLERHRKQNSSYELGVQRIMLDWSLYVFQSRNKPMSYYFPTLNVHLWMTLYNETVRNFERKYIHDIGECLNLPQYVNVLEEARLLAIIYLKSFQNAWQDYSDWIAYSDVNRDTYNQENQILSGYGISNKHIFLTLYAQNFCDFGKELAQNIFYIGIQQNADYYNTYSCGNLRELRADCI